MLDNTMGIRWETRPATGAERSEWEREVRGEPTGPIWGIAALIVGLAVGGPLIVLAVSVCRSIRQIGSAFFAIPLSVITGGIGAVILWAGVKRFAWFLLGHRPLYRAARVLADPTVDVLNITVEDGVDIFEEDEQQIVLFCREPNATIFWYAPPSEVTRDAPQGALYSSAVPRNIRIELLKGEVVAATGSGESVVLRDVEAPPEFWQAQRGVESQVQVFEGELPEWLAWVKEDADPAGT